MGSTAHNPRDRQEVFGNFEDSSPAIHWRESTGGNRQSRVAVPQRAGSSEKRNGKRLKPLACGATHRPRCDGGPAGLRLRSETAPIFCCFPSLPCCFVAGRES